MSINNGLLTQLTVRSLMRDIRTHGFIFGDDQFANAEISCVCGPQSPVAYPKHRMALWTELWQRSGGLAIALVLRERTRPLQKKPSQGGSDVEPSFYGI